VDSSQLDTISVKTSDNVTLGYSVAGLGSRLVAQILDNLFAIPLTLIAVLLYGALASVFVTSTAGTTFADAGAGFFAGFVYFGYFFVAEAVTSGKTPGKSAMGLRVIRIDGSAADFGAIAVRNVIRIVDVAVVRSDRQLRARRSSGVSLAPGSEPEAARRPRRRHREASARPARAAARCA